MLLAIIVRLDVSIVFRLEMAILIRLYEWRFTPDPNTIVPCVTLGHRPYGAARESADGIRLRSGCGLS